MTFFSLLAENLITTIIIRIFIGKTIIVASYDNIYILYHHLNLWWKEMLKLPGLATTNHHMLTPLITDQQPYTELIFFNSFMKICLFHITGLYLPQGKEKVIFPPNIQCHVQKETCSTYYQWLMIHDSDNKTRTRIQRLQYIIKSYNSSLSQIQHILYK